MFSFLFTKLVAPGDFSWWGLVISGGLFFYPVHLVFLDRAPTCSLYRFPVRARLQGPCLHTGPPYCLISPHNFPQGRGHRPLCTEILLFISFLKNSLYGTIVRSLFLNNNPESIHVHGHLANDVRHIFKRVVIPMFFYSCAVHAMPLQLIIDFPHILVS